MTFFDLSMLALYTLDTFGLLVIVYALRTLLSYLANTKTEDWFSEGIPLQRHFRRFTILFIVGFLMCALSSSSLCLSAVAQHHCNTHTSLQNQEK